MLGYSAHEMIGKSGLDFLDEEGVALSNLNVEKRKQDIKDSYEFNSGSGEGRAGSPHAFRLGMKA